jgi:hypothetical protein
MQKPQGYDEVQAVEIGSFEQLQLGGHICQIVKAESFKTTTGKEAIKFYLDIADEPQKGYYKRQYDKDTRNPKKWGCIFIQLTEGNSTQYFKGVITAIEKSNPQYRWNWNETSLKGLLVGGVFGREQYKKNNGELAWFTKCVNIRSLEAILEGVEVPEDKYLNDTEFDRAFDNAIFQPVADEDIPF